eukprot:scaffold8163_cov78-Phaeocystis_antarctica.AAC.2
MAPKGKAQPTASTASAPAARLSLQKVALWVQTALLCLSVASKAARSKSRLGSAPARVLRLLWARLAALTSSALPGRGRPTGSPATASGARASRLQRRRYHRL